MWRRINRENAGTFRTCAQWRRLSRSYFAPLIFYLSHTSGYVGGFDSISGPSAGTRFLQRVGMIYPVVRSKFRNLRSLPFAVQKEKKNENHSKMLLVALSDKEFSIQMGKV